jgi:hypothetical protein
MRDPTALPWLAVAALFVLPIAVAAFAGFVTFRKMTPLVYRCRRCRRDFRRAPYHRFPAACPHCSARDWAAPG